MNVPADCGGNTDQHLDVYREIRSRYERHLSHMLCFRILDQRIFIRWESLEAMDQNIHYDSTSLTFMIFTRYFLLESSISCLVNAGLPEMNVFSLL
jgi:hypothetical protein